MDFLNGTIAFLAFIVLLLTALVAWMYVQQTRLMQTVSALSTAITTPPISFYEASMNYPVQKEEEMEEQTYGEETYQMEEIDDRVSVHEEQEPEPEPEKEVPAPAVEEDFLSDKKVSELREMLTAKGIPYNKSDKKPTLLNLLKAAS
jgi:hypothetical protein